MYKHSKRFSEYCRPKVDINAKEYRNRTSNFRINIIINNIGLNVKMWTLSCRHIVE